MINKVDHIGIAVQDLDESIEFYSKTLGLELKGIEEVPEQKVKVAFLKAGEIKIELLESTDPQGPIGKFIAKQGPGMHHIAYNVSDIEAALKKVKDKGARLIDEKPRLGGGGARIAFVHPKSSLGVLTELCQK